MSWIDIIFIAIIAIFAISGLWKGLLDSILGLITSVVSIFLSIWWAKPFAKFIRKIVDFDNIFYKMLKGDTISFLGLSFEKEKFSAFLSVLTCGVIIFVLIRLGVWVISKIFDSATASNSSLSGLNRLFGLLFGIAKGLLINCLILSGAFILINTNLAPNLKTSIDNTKVTSFFYKYTSDYVSKKLSGSKIESIVDDMEITEREEETENNAHIAKSEEYWQIAETYTSGDSTSFIANKDGSYILYYDTEGTSTPIILTSSNIDIKYSTTSGTLYSSVEEAFTLGAEETSRTIKVKIIYNVDIDTHYDLTLEITITTA